MRNKIFLGGILVVFLTWGVCNGWAAFPGHPLPALSGATSFHPPTVLSGNAKIRPIASDREDQDSNKGNYEALEKQLKALSDEIKRLEKNVRDKIHKEMLPHLRKEIEKLKKWLKELRPEKERQEPVLTRGGRFLCIG